MEAGPWESWGRLRGSEQKLLQEANGQGETLGLEAFRRRKRRRAELRGGEGEGEGEGDKRSLEIRLRRGNLEAIVIDLHC